MLIHVISGYHYGIFTCESCKGFFKRTVQNKKVFQCHRNSDCDVMRGNRKKCPACRFAKCMSAGMKIEGKNIKNKHMYICMIGYLYMFIVHTTCTLNNKYVTCLDLRVTKNKNPHYHDYMYQEKGIRKSGNLVGKSS